MAATLILTTQGDLDPDSCGSCNGPIGVGDSSFDAFVPYVLIPDPDTGDGPDELIGYDLDCAVRHCGVVIEVRG